MADTLTGGPGRLPRIRLRAAKLVLVSTALALASIALVMALAVPVPAFTAAGTRPSSGAPFIKGADISFLQEIEDNGGVFSEAGVPEDAIAIFKDHGFNYIRLRLWHAPPARYNNLAQTLLMARRVKQRGLGLLLDIHYSDTWADPGKQGKPGAWEGLPFPVLKDSVYEYTRHVITELEAGNALPDMVQIGNEITCGMLWDDGRVCGTWDVPEQWEKLGDLVEEAIRGVREGTDAEDSVRIVIHIDQGGDADGSVRFLDRLLAQGVDFDVIGLSFYPWWHGSLSDLGANLDTLARRYGKDIAVVETAYPWTLDWYDDTHNLVGLPGQLHDGYPASVEGQKSFLADLMDIVAGVRDGRGLGLFYWAPEWISAPAKGSAWENVALFNFQGEALPSISAFDSADARTDSTKGSGCPAERSGPR